MWFNLKTTTNLVLCFLLISATSSFLLPSTSAKILKDTLYCCESETLPTIDGKFETDEWLQAIPIDVTLYKYSNISDTITFKVMSIFGKEDKNLYYGVSIPLNNLTNCFFYIFAKTNQTDDFLHNAGDYLNYRFGRGHDVKAFWILENKTIDFRTDGVGVQGTKDTDSAIGGSYDGLGRCHYNSTHINCEMCFPMDSGDRAGGDFSLKRNGATLELIFWFLIANPYTSYSPILFSELDYEFILLKIGCSDTLPSQTHIALVGVFVITVILAKKKKREKRI